MAEEVICRGGDGSEHKAYWRKDRACSYCGSMHPDDFLEAMRQTLDPTSPVYIDQTTKSYKRYVMLGNGERRKFYLWHIPNDDWAAEANKMNEHVIKFSNTKMEREVNATMAAMAATDKERQNAD